MANEYALTIAGPVTLTLNTETVIATSASLSVNNPGGQGLNVNGFVEITPGASATAFTIRVRRGSISGAVIGTTTNGATTAYAESIPYSFNDSTLSGNVVYVLTAQQTAATGNGSCGPASITVVPNNVNL